MAAQVAVALVKARQKAGLQEGRDVSKVEFARRLSSVLDQSITAGDLGRWEQAQGPEPRASVMVAAALLAGIDFQGLFELGIGDQLWRIRPGADRSSAK